MREKHTYESIGTHVHTNTDSETFKNDYLFMQILIICNVVFALWSLVIWSGSL